MGQKAMASATAKKIPNRCKKTPKTVVKCWYRAENRDGACIPGDNVHLNETLSNLPWASR